MNFTEFDFWWILIRLMGLLFLLRFVGTVSGIWRPSYDRTALMLISLTLFWNAASTSFGIFIVELLVNYFVMCYVIRHKDKRSFFLVVVVSTLNISVLFYFKYLDFMLGNFLGFILGNENFGWFYSFSKLKEGVSIPPGISFYTFQMIAFLIDSVKKDVDKPVKFIDYINFASFFPQVVAGPIERRSTLYDQIKIFRFKFSKNNIDEGFAWLSLGLFMKFVIADNVSQFVYFNEAENPWVIWLSIYFFGFKIYYDFAGYSFIALGVAKVLGINLTVNFQAPYLASNIQDFWRRWHVTLSTWFRDYLYIFLGGSRVKYVSFNLMIVFIISGLWHGAGWNYAMWGAFHGLLIVVYRALKQYLNGPNIIGYLTNSFFVSFGWLFFMETDFPKLTQKISTLINYKGYSLENFTFFWGSLSELEYGLLAVCFSLTFGMLLLEKLGAMKGEGRYYHYLLTPMVSRILLSSTLLIGAKEPSEFVYFAF